MKNASQIRGERRNPLTYLFGKTWQYSAGNRDNVVRYWWMFIIANAIILTTQPYISAKIIKIVQTDRITSQNIRLLYVWLVLSLGPDLIFWAFHGPARVLERVNAFMARANYRRFLLRGVMSMPLDWHAEHHSGDTIDKIEKGASALYAVSSETFEIISGIVQLAISWAVLTYFSHSAGAIVLIMLLVTAWVIMRFDRLIIRDYSELNRAENRVSESVCDTITNITTVIILRIERQVFETISTKIDQSLPLYRSNNIRNEMKWFLTNICGRIMYIVVLAAYLWKNVGSDRREILGELYLLMRYLDTIRELFYSFCMMYGNILQRRSRIMNAEELAVDFQETSFANHVLPADWRLIEVRNLNFSYQSGEEGDLHLEDVAFKVFRGERIAIVGKSGGGKSTLFKVLRGLHEPRTIDLMVDNARIPEGFDGIKNAITLVPQLAEIFKSSILDNITVGADHDMETVRRFMDMACFTEVVDPLPQGLEAMIGEKGVNLSGGQNHRLALTRGLLACADKSIVLLDEPTTGLDVLTESKVIDNIFREFADKSILVSIHGLRLLPRFDRVIVFADGKIVGNGTVAELSESCPEFRALLMEQGKKR